MDPEQQAIYIVRILIVAMINLCAIAVAGLVAPPLPFFLFGRFG